MLGWRVLENCFYLMTRSGSCYTHNRPVASIKWLGGLSEWPTLTPPPPSLPPLKAYMSDHYICLQYLLYLSLIFRLCWLWRNRELVWDIVHGKFAKQLLSVFFLPKVVISYISTGVRASIPDCTEEQQCIILIWSTILWNPLTAVHFSRKIPLL